MFRGLYLGPNSKELLESLDIQELEDSGDCCRVRCYDAVAGKLFRGHVLSPFSDLNQHFYSGIDRADGDDQDMSYGWRCRAGRGALGTSISCGECFWLNNVGG